MGEDRCECNMTVEAAGTILDAPQHEQSLGKIEYLENLNKFAKDEVEDFGPPVSKNFA